MIEKLLKINWFRLLLSIFSATDDITYTAHEFEQKAKESKKQTLIISVLGVFWACLLITISASIYFLSTSDTLFHVEAKTEYLTILSKEDSSFPEWGIGGAEVFDDCDDESLKLSGTLQINSGVSIEISRIDKGMLSIALISNNDQSIGTLKTFQISKKLSSCVYVKFVPLNGNSWTLPIDGDVVLGSSLKEGIARIPLLQSGNIYITDKASLSQEYYTSEPKQFSLGDRFVVNNPTTQSSGVIMINEEPYIHVSYNVKGEKGLIERYKSEPIVLKNSFWTKLFNDETLIILWFIVVALYTVIKIVIRVNLD